MKWEIKDRTKLPIKSWCEEIEPGAIDQARNLANHPAVFSHVALMPDCHVGYGMPIGGVIACDNAVYEYSCYCLMNIGRKRETA